MRVATGVGVVAAMTAVGGGVGTIIAGPIITTLDYHWLFWIPFIMCVIAAVATQAALRPCGPIFGPKNRISTNEASGMSQARPRSCGSWVARSMMRLVGAGAGAALAVES